MTEEQIKDACKEYLTKSGLKVVKAERQPTDVHAIGASEQFKHCAYMCEKILSGELDGKTEKLMRWIGFIQGVLWTSGEYTIDSLKDQNR